MDEFNNLPWLEEVDHTRKLGLAGKMEQERNHFLSILRSHRLNVRLLKILRSYHLNDRLLKILRSHQLNVHHLPNYNPLRTIHHSRHQEFHVHLLTTIHHNLQRHRRHHRKKESEPIDDEI
jgi:hypothetical protein